MPFRSVVRALGAVLLAERGANVVVNDLGVFTDQPDAERDAERAERAAEAIRQAGGSAVSDTGDVTSPEDVRTMVGLAATTFGGGVDILVHNAGLFFSDGVGTATAHELQRQLDVHVVAGLVLAQEVWPHMARQGRGRIVMTTSMAAYGSERTLTYGIAKAAVLGLVHGLAVPGREHGITVNALGPQAYTPMAQRSRGKVIEADPELSLMWGLHTEERVAAGVAALVHDSCTATGRIYQAGGGLFARTAWVHTPGWLGLDPTPEDVAAHWEEIDDLGEAAPHRGMEPEGVGMRERVVAAHRGVAAER